MAKKISVKKAGNKKAAAKKTAVKKAGIKKATGKKTVVKKKAPKKAVAKKAAPKKPVAKKAVAKKPVSNKKITAVKKATGKKAGVKKIAVVKKIAAAPQKITAGKKPAVKKAVPEVAPVAPVPEQLALFTEPLPAAHIDIPLPSITALPEDLVSKAANIKTALPVTATTGNKETNAAKATEHPLTAFDKHVFEKATAKGDPQSKLRLSSVNKSTIKPSGKKPLWNK
jgi:hypothetical protein